MMAFFTENTEQVVKVTSAATYSVSGSLMLADLINTLDHHAAAIGVILGTLTFIANLIFQYLNHKVIKSNHGERRRR